MADPAEPTAATIRTLLRSARHLVDDAGRAVARAVAGGRRPGVRRKGKGDFVTALDLAIERRMRQQLRATHPEHGFIGEETRAHSPDADYAWIVDPIDGTSNFARGLPHYGVSAACLFRGQPVAAAVFCMPESALYSAGLGLGAFRGRRRLRTPPGRLDDGAIIGAQWFRDSNDLGFVQRLIRTGARIRTFGCTVAQLCEVAAGRLDANVQQQGRVWDIAAAVLVLREAGACCTSWRGKEIFPVSSLVAPVHHATLAAPRNVHGRLLRVLQNVS